MIVKNLFIGILIFLGACTGLVQDEFPEFEETPVVNGIFKTDSLFGIHISLTGKVNAQEFKIIENAEIRLFKNNNFIEALTYLGKGVYLSSTMAEAKNNYYCEVDIPQHETIFFQDSLPSPKKIKNIVHINDAGKDEEGITYPAIRFTFSNSPGEKAYYEVIIRLIEYSSESIASLEEITDPVILNEGLPLALFSNETIQDSVYCMTLNYSTNTYSYYDGMRLYPLIIEFRRVSYNYYQFRKHYYLYEKGRYPDGINAAFTTFNMHSNIENGYGIFAGYSTYLSDTIYP